MESAGMRYREVHQAAGMLIAHVDLPASAVLAGRLWLDEAFGGDSP
ncbi:hypothetical protein ACFVYA_07725 [Amycolatopsis sp. NPDC058278]